MFEQPAIKDIDYALSMLMHEARREVADEKNRITSEAIKHGALQSNRVVVVIADAVDRIHKESVEKAKQILLDFIPRMKKPATEITARARLHLDNLSTAVLAEVPPNGFPDDHQRITKQYQAHFQQRVEGALREVEIGYGRDTGFSGLTGMSEKEEWISAARAVVLTGMSPYSAKCTICKRARAGLIKARAERFIDNGKSADDVDVPAEFWWADGGKALNQNWTTGDFDTWIKSSNHLSSNHLQAFGVTFRRSDIERFKSTESGHDMKAPGNKVFIGHGHSPVWRELKDFIQDRLKLSWEEFNQVPVAGVANTARLAEMLDASTIAFLIMTGEDETQDGTMRARMNVVHEAGLFQGRLGFNRAIILLEEGCEGFSNIEGLGQIRFPKGNIKAAFEEIRKVLERENLAVP
jgi:hypothetical protein